MKYGQCRYFGKCEFMTRGSVIIITSILYYSGAAKLRTAKCFFFVSEKKEIARRRRRDVPNLYSNFLTVCNCEV